MATTVSFRDQHDDLASAASPVSLVAMLLAAVLGALGAIVVLPYWLPSLAASVLGPSPKAYWYLSRASALVAYVLLWQSMSLGLLITNRVARVWPGGPLAVDLHQYVSLLGLAFSLFHGLILLGDSYSSYTLSQILVPFGSTNYRPLGVGLGQLAFYVLAVVGLSFYTRHRLGVRLWRLIHYLSFVVFVLGLAHGLLSGTDTRAPVVSNLYWLSGGSLLFLTCYRVLRASRRVAVLRRLAA